VILALWYSFTRNGHLDSNSRRSRRSFRRNLRRLVDRFKRSDDFNAFDGNSRRGIIR
jgi:hypothetical protein